MKSLAVRPVPTGLDRNLELHLLSLRGAIEDMQKNIGAGSGGQPVQGERGPPGPQGEPGGNIPVVLPYGVIGFYQGPVPAQALIIFYVAAWPCVFDGAETSRIECLTAPTAQAVFKVMHITAEESNEVGRFILEAGNLAGELEQVPFILDEGDIVQVWSPDPADATLADVTITLAGQRVTAA